MSVTPERERRIVHMLKNGVSQNAVALAIGVSKHAVRRIGLARGVKFRPGPKPKVIKTPTPRELHDERIVRDYTPVKGLRRKCDGCNGWVTTRGCLACDMRKEKERERELATA